MKNEKAKRETLGGGEEWNTQELWDNYKRCNIHTSIMRIQEREEREKGTKEIFEATMTEHLPQVNLIHQTIDPENSENTKQDKNYTCEKRKNYT